MKIEAMNLEPAAKQKAQQLKNAAPGVVFTSGRRTVEQQARAMAQNVVSAGRVWIRSTYARSEARDALIDWLHHHTEATTVQELEAGFAIVLSGFTSEQLSHLSKHFSGRAFDVQPHSCAVSDLQNLHPHTLLLHEGGLERWHVDF